MEQKKRRPQLSADAWRAILDRFAGSGLTVQAFCQREALNTASFYNWRSRLARTARDSDSNNASTETGTDGFVDLGTLSASPSRFELRLDLGGGVLLHLARG